MGVTTIPAFCNAFQTADGNTFVIRKVNDARVVVLPAVCKHRGGPLNLGDLDEEKTFVTCPWHATRTKIPSAASRRMPFVYATSGNTTVIVGADIDRAFRLPVLERNDPV